LAFKANTDDLRESPNIDLARNLLKVGYDLSIFDPAVDATKLVGANLGYAYTQLPALQNLLVSKEIAETQQYDRIIVANPTIKQLNLAEGQDIVDLNALA